MNGTGAGAFDWLTVDVGGKIFSTPRSTFLKHPDSMLARMFGPEVTVVQTHIWVGFHRTGNCPNFCLYKKHLDLLNL